MHTIQNILVTGGCGFIGTNFIKYLLDNIPFKGHIINLDKLTYAGHRHNLKEYDKDDRYIFVKGDINDQSKVKKILKKYNIDTVIHFAAESHVDNSISEPFPFIQTNIMGTFSMLEAIRQSNKRIHFHHVSTDEVYGSLDAMGAFNEQSNYKPRSPYSASKASSDHLVMAYHYSYGLPITMSNCSNNYGPYQNREKLIPLVIHHLLTNKKIPIYGDGLYIRDWLYVSDHCKAIWLIINRGKNGQRYNVGGNNEWSNIDLVTKLCQLVAEEKDWPVEKLLSQISYVSDRAGHDRRYAIDASKIQQELGFTTKTTFDDGLRATVQYYLAK